MDCRRGNSSEKEDVDVTHLIGAGLLNCLSEEGCGTKLIEYNQSAHLIPARQNLWSLDQAAPDPGRFLGNGSRNWSQSSLPGVQPMYGSSNWSAQLTPLEKQSQWTNFGVANLDTGPSLAAPIDHSDSYFSSLQQPQQTPPVLRTAIKSYRDAATGKEKDSMSQKRHSSSDTSSYYGLDTFSDSENLTGQPDIENSRAGRVPVFDDGKSRPPPPRLHPEQAANLATFISKSGSRNSSGSNNKNAFKKNAKTGTMESALSKKSGEKPRSPSQGDNVLKDSEQVELPKNHSPKPFKKIKRKGPRKSLKENSEKEKEKTEQKHVSVSYEQGDGSVSFPNSRFSLLTDLSGQYGKICGAIRSVVGGGQGAGGEGPDRGVGGQMAAKGQQLAKGAGHTVFQTEMVLNNRKNLMSPRSASGNRETAYINNNFMEDCGDEPLGGYGSDRDESTDRSAKTESAKGKDVEGKTGSKGGFLSGGNGSAIKGKNVKRKRDGHKHSSVPSHITAIETFIIWFDIVCTWVFGALKTSIGWLCLLIWDVGSQLMELAIHYGKRLYLYVHVSVVRAQYVCSEKWRSFCTIVKCGWKPWISAKSNSAGLGLDENISLPTTGEEAMSRLLSCKGQDAYSILGLQADCSDEDVRRFYRRQAFLVHPDKNPQYGADEAFRILAHAFEHIGTPERRKKYDLENIYKTKEMQEFESMLNQLHQKMEEALNTMHCDCGKKHRRYKVKRSLIEARSCRRCKELHSVREGDIWAESHWFGFLWYFYACMDGAVYDITEWAGCQKNNLKHMKANTHLIQYRLITGRNRQQSQQNRGLSEGEMEEFLRKLCESACLPQAGAPGNSVGNGPGEKSAEGSKSTFTSANGTSSGVSAKSSNGTGGMDFHYNPPPAAGSQNRGKKAPRRRKGRC